MKNNQSDIAWNIIQMMNPESIFSTSTTTESE